MQVSRTRTGAKWHELGPVVDSRIPFTQLLYATMLVICITVRYSVGVEESLDEWLSWWLSSLRGVSGQGARAGQAARLLKHG